MLTGNFVALRIGHLSLVKKCHLVIGLQPGFCLTCICDETLMRPLRRRNNGISFSWAFFGVPDIVRH